MRINQEQFDKLNQLDRIEFRQKEDRINDRLGFSPNLLKYWSIMGFVFILDLWVKLRTNVWINGQSIIWMIFLIGLCMIFEVIINLVFAILYVKETRKLYSQYFDIKINPRRK